MSYIPVGTLLTYTCQFEGAFNFISGTISTWEDLAARLKTDLPQLPGAEELDVESSNGTNVVLSGINTLSIQVLNNGVDHSSETDVQSLIDGQIQSYGIKLVASNITSITLPNNPLDDQSGQTILTPGVTPNAPLPVPPVSTPPGGGSFSVGTGKGFSLSSILGTSGTITGGVVLLLIAIVALILLLPGGFGRALGAVRR